MNAESPPSKLDTLPTQSVHEEESFVTGQDASLMLLANELISKAIDIRCSDMHVEPDEEHTILRYLKNRELLLESKLPKPVHLELVFCYKVIAGLNINETSKPQDKKAVLKISGSDVQFRVTTIPGDYGETVAISFKFD